MIAFIDVHRARFGVEPICSVLCEHGCKIAPNTYWVARKRPPSKRSQRDVELVVEIRRVYEKNLFVYGADKVWTQLNREGHPRGSLHRGAPDASRGPVRGPPRQGVQGHDPRR